MGSSTRARLKAGNIPSAQTELEEAIRHIQSAIEILYDRIAGEDQTDNANDDGGMIEMLLLAKNLINEEIP